MPRALHYKIANTPTEFAAIHRLNYRTFVEEIPQHSANEDGVLVDKFHAENTYAVCLDGDALVGMLAGRSARPFSLDGKLDDLDRHLPPGRRPVEIRLLAVERSYRHSVMLPKLIELLASHFAELGCDLAVISGTTRAIEMYRRMGFVPFGPLTGAPEAQYQPMYLASEAVARWRWTEVVKPSRMENFLPGPVSVAPEVTEALSQPPAYHRSPAYLSDLANLHRRLADLVNSAHCQLLMGSGTLANDVVAGQLKLLGEPGVVVANGEFGERLADHATRWGLDFTTVTEIEQAPAAAWWWATHCETSTGTLLDLPKAVARAQGTRLVLDCISSIGTVPIDLSQVFMATGASGKALGSYPGIAMVFFQTHPQPAPDRLPRYLDLGTYVAAGGVAFTQSSNLVNALDAALTVTDWPDRYARLARAATWLHHRLQRLGFTVVAPIEQAAPGICTIELPPGIDATEVGRRMEAEGYLLAYQSGYLRTHNWLQIALMGQWTWPALRALPPALQRVTFDY